jgi:hypothetical protein
VFNVVQDRRSVLVITTLVENRKNFGFKPKAKEEVESSLKITKEE